ncbi:CopG family transcriptional regulator [Candidatus Uhrbacteria bacterium]|nr:CopG family transcriptional regulator [Candidatus Uhrbacteria bacterium]
MNKKRIKNLIPAAIAALFIVGVIVVFKQPSGTASPSTDFISSQRPKAIVYRSPTCGCCGNYVSYLKKMGFEVETKFVQSTSEIEQQYGIPNNLLSCHTTVIGDYAIEGHVPAEAIAKLLQEKPAIRGIALPGMPSGSPGMPGAKRGEFSIYGFKDGGSDIFTSI